MTRMMNALGDRLLGRLLGSVSAGACIPEHGQICGYGHYTCTGSCK